ncbi:hypothetical protein AYI69_g9699 [Smittium culicis]|uniref:Uncharacterized protein n=1 Tax=Smittium culicis TaxID=133412 RepID=A0A1R1XB18_9FUNG|nr:hypothetical protein AYI69_g9699 [Smittium culicis]
MSDDKPLGNGRQFSEYDAQSSFIQGHGPKKGSLKAIEGGTFVSGAQAEVMELKIVPTRDPRAGNLYRFQRHCLWNSCGLSIILRFVESLKGVDVHQLQRVIGNFLRALTTDNCWSFDIGLLRQYQKSRVHYEFWCINLSKIFRVFRNDLQSLSEDEYSPSGYIYIRPSVQEDIGTIRDTRCKPVRIVDEHESGTILELVPRHNPAMKNENMVPEYSGSISLLTAITTESHRNTRPKKWKMTAI